MNKDKLSKYIVQYLLETNGYEIWLGGNNYDSVVKDVENAINNLENKRMLWIKDDKYEGEFVCDIDNAQIELEYNKENYEINRNAYVYAKYTTKERCEEILNEMKEFYDKYKGEKTYILPQE